MNGDDRPRDEQGGGSGCYGCGCVFPVLALALPAAALLLRWLS
jgi:hypothetical protein